MRKSYVLDSWAAIAYLQGEPASELIADLMADAFESDGEVRMSIINLGEVWYIFARETSDKTADAAVAELRGLGIRFVDADWELTKSAATLKANGRISYADAFAAALAQHHKCELVTGDVEFKAIESKVRIRWV